VVVVAVVVYHTEALYTHLSPVTTTSCYRAKLQETIKIHSTTYMLNLFQSTVCLTFTRKPRNMAIFIRYKFLNRLVVHIILQKSRCQNHVQCPVRSARAFYELLFPGTFQAFAFSSCLNHFPLHCSIAQYRSNFTATCILIQDLQLFKTFYTKAKLRDFPSAT